MTLTRNRILPLLLSVAVILAPSCGEAIPNPYQAQIEQQVALLKAPAPTARAKAIEHLSSLRAFTAAPAVEACLLDSDPGVRREAAMNLGWTGSWRNLDALVAALKDADWSVRQAAGVALQNLTGRSVRFDSLAVEANRTAQIRKWEQWTRTLEPNAIPEALSRLVDSRQFEEKARGCRALGALGNPAGSTLIIDVVGPYVTRQASDFDEKFFVQSAIRALGRLGLAGGRVDASVRQLLIDLLDNSQWAVYAAEALGDIGDAPSAEALIRVYPDYGMMLTRGGQYKSYKPLVGKFHFTDAPALSAIDRIPRNAHAILMAISRCDLSQPSTIEALKSIGPHIVATMPNDWDATMVYEEEAWQLISAFLLEKAGLRQAVVSAVFTVLGQPRDIPDRVACRSNLLVLAAENMDRNSAQYPPYAGPILSTCCREAADIPAVIGLLSHTNGWIKIHAAKTLMFMKAGEAIEPLCALLREARDDADYGYGADFTRFNNVARGDGYDEYNDPCPRYKEAFLRALGRLNATSAVPLLVRYLNNSNNVVEIQYAAAVALGHLATPEALAALADAERRHPFQSIRLRARETLWLHKMTPPAPLVVTPPPSTEPPRPVPSPGSPLPALVFIKGPLDAENAYQIPKTMQAYTTSDSGPTYRLGTSICSLSPVATNGTVTTLTHFTDGFVADLEVSYMTAHK